MSAFESALTRIRACRTLPDCARMDASLTRLYDAGVLTPAELRKLDLKLCDRQIRVENDPTYCVADIVLASASEERLTV